MLSRPRERSAAAAVAKAAKLIVSAQFGMFAKYWQPGTVKTRLAATIGDEAASDVYRHFVRTLLERFRNAAPQVVLAFTPDGRRSDFQRLVTDQWQLESQGDGDLGQRMRSYFASAFSRGNKRVVLIGSDSPTLPTEYVREAFERLSDHEVVLGPSEDGGYYLIGMARHVPTVFDRIDWSTPDVWQQTTKRLEQEGTTYACLSPWYDVDTLDDLRRLKRELGGTTQRAQARHGLLNALDAIEI